MYHLCLVFVMISSLLITALWSAAEKRLTDWPSSVAFICICVTFYAVSWARCGTLLYRLMIFAPFLLL